MTPENQEKLIRCLILSDKIKMYQNLYGEDWLKVYDEIENEKEE